MGTEQKKKNESKEKSKDVNCFSKWGFVISFISFAEIAFLIALFVLVCIGEIDGTNLDGMKEAGILSEGIAIIGVAVSVWAGLNIAYMIDKKELDDLRSNTETQISKTIEKQRRKEEEINGELKEYKKELDDLSIKADTRIDKAIEEQKQKAKEICKQLDDYKKEYEGYIEEEIILKSQRQYAEKYELIAEFFNTENDPATSLLMKRFEEYNIPKNISLMNAVQMERLYSMAYHSHKNEYDQNDSIVKYSDEGIEFANNQLKIIDGEENDLLANYIIFRKACFNFLKGYCYHGKDRKGLFDKAIDGLEKVKDTFEADIPEYKEYDDYSAIAFEECSPERKNMSAYFCNMIGESFSKVIQDKTSLSGNMDDAQIHEYEKKAIYYCGHARKWAKREIYYRNYGCALERVYGIQGDNYNYIKGIYLEALELGEVAKTHKVLLSILDKRINALLEIGFVKPENERHPALGDGFYKKHYDSLEDSQKLEIKNMLKELHDRSVQAQRLHPNESVGYVYNCIYYRDLCVIKESDSSEVIEYLKRAENEIEILKMLKVRAQINGIATMLEKDIKNIREMIGAQI